MVKNNVQKSKLASGNKPATKPGSKSKARASTRLASGFSRAQTAPVARSSQARGQSYNDDSMTLVRREYIGPVLGSVAFTATGYNDNPALPTMYNRTWQIAASYEKYTPLKRSFVFKTATTTSSVGSVVLSYDYDALDSIPTDLTEAFQSKDFSEGQPWHEEIRLTLKPKDLSSRGDKNTLYTRTGTVSGTDLKTYDTGKLTISTVGQASAALVGHLWVEFHTRLMIFQGPPNPGTIVTSGGTVSKTAVFGTAATYSNISPVTASGSVLTFNQPGYFLLNLYAYTMVGSALPTATASTGSVATVDIYIEPTADTSSVTTIYVKMLQGGTLTMDYSGSTSLSAMYTQIAPWYRS